VASWLVPSACQNIPVQPAHYLPPQKILLVENRFLQASKGAENTIAIARKQVPLCYLSHLEKKTLDLFLVEEKKKSFCNALWL
jgi:hypothetical protein